MPEPNIYGVHEVDTDMIMAKDVNPITGELMLPADAHTDKTKGLSENRTFKRWWGICLTCSCLHTRWAAKAVTNQTTGESWAYLANFSVTSCGVMGCDGLVGRLGDQAYQDICDAAYRIGGPPAVTAVVKADFPSEVAGGVRPASYTAQVAGTPDPGANADTEGTEL